MKANESLKKLFQFDLSILVISIFFSLSAAFLLFFHYFQSYGISTKRLAFGLAAVFVFAVVMHLGLQWVTKRFFQSNKDALRTFGFWLLLALILSPTFLPIPHYPGSPLFQATADVRVSISFPEEADGLVQLKGVWLSYGDEKISSSEFSFSDEWVQEGDRYFLDADSQGEMVWEGKVSERTTLTIFPLDTPANVVVVWDGEESSAALTDSPLVVQRKNVTPLWYYTLIVVARLLVIGTGLFVFFTLFQSVNDQNWKQALIYIPLIVFSVFTIYAQFQNPEINGRMDLLMERHMAVINGMAPGHWQYRILAEWLIEGMVWVARSFGMADPYFMVFVILRTAQNLLIFFLAFAYFRKSGFSEFFSLIGIVFVTGSMLNAFHQSDLSFGTYFDVVFYLIAVLILMADVYKWLPLLMVFAALNRETSGLIPLMALAMIGDLRKEKSKVFIIGVCLLIWALAYLGLRQIFPERPAWAPYGNEAGIPLLLYNLTPGSLGLVFRFFSIVPLLGLLAFKDWSPTLKRFFLSLVPIYVGIHMFIGVIAEARLFLVPQLIVFIPSFIVFIRLVWEKGVQTGAQGMERLP